VNVYGFDLEFFTSQGFRPFAEDSYVISSAWCGPSRDDEPQFCRKRNSKILKAILADPSNTLVGHNLGAADYIFWEAEEKKHGRGRSIKAKPFDTMVAQTLIDENIPSNSLAYISEKYLGETKLDVDIKKIEDVPLKELRKYNKQDARLSRRLYEPLMEQLERKDLLLIFGILMEVMDVLIDMQLRGISIDFDWLNIQGEKIYEDVKDALKKINDFCGREINPGSYKQLGAFLYDELNLPVLVYTKTGKPATNEEALLKLNNEPHLNEQQKDFLNLILLYRKLDKLYSTYLLPLADKYIGFDERCHTLYYLGRGTDEWHRKSIYGARTGRLASREPNLQNQPNDPRIRGCFVPSKGMKLFKADYAQLEMRIAGYLSKDPELQNTFRQDLDIHTHALALTTGETYEFIIAALANNNPGWIDARRNIKPYNFGMIYGANWYVLQSTLLTELGIWVEADEIKRRQKLWKKGFNGAITWQKNVHTIIDYKREVVSSTGRVRRFPKGHASWKDLNDWHKQGFNAIIQSFAVDITLIAMIQLRKELEAQDSFILLNVHDSLEGEYHPDIEDKLTDIIHYSFIEYPLLVLEEDFELDVSDLYLKVDLETGLDRWK